MSINVIGTLKPKNNGNFPVVEAIDVFVQGYTSLADAVTHFATDAMIQAINTVLSGKADESDLTTAVTNLQNQINEIITPVTQDAEVQNARVDAEGKTYTTLKERLDTSETQTKANIEGLKDKIYTDEENEKNILSTLTFPNKGFYDKTTGVYEASAQIYGTTNLIEIPKNAVAYNVSLYAYKRMSGVTFLMKMNTLYHQMQQRLILQML